MKISLKEKVCYGLGDSGFNVIWFCVASFFAVYYTQALQLGTKAIALLGTLFLASKVIDVATDLTMGWLVDRTKTIHGRARPWILRMTLPFAVSTILLFAVPAAWSETAKLIYIFVMFNLCQSIFATSVNIPFASMTALMTDDDSERVKITSTRLICGITGQILIGFAFVPLITFFGGMADPAAWPKTFAVLAIPLVGFYALTFFGTKERVEPAKQTSTIGILTKVKALATSKLFWLVALMMIALNTKLPLTLGGGMQHLIHKFGKPELFGVLMLGFLGAALVSFFVVNFIKTDKKNVITYANAGVLLVLSAQLFLRNSLSGILVTTVLNGFGSGLLLAVFFVMYADLADEIRKKYDFSAEGISFATNSIATKIGNGLAGAVIGWCFALFATRITAGTATMFIVVPLAMHLAIAAVILILNKKKD